TTSECLCSTTFPKKTKRGGHGRRHLRYCSLLLMAWPTSERPHVKSSLRYFSRPSGWRNDREALGSSSVQARQRFWPGRSVCFCKLDIVHRDPTAWLPFLDTYRTMCRAPEPAFRTILEDMRELRFAA